MAGLITPTTGIGTVIIAIAIDGVITTTGIVIATTVTKGDSGF